LNSSPDIYSKFYDFLVKEKRCSIHTLRGYKTDLSQFCTYMFENYETETLSSIESDWVRSWVVSMMRNGLSPRSIHRKVSSIRTFTKFARRRGEMQLNPLDSVVLPKLQKRLPEVVPVRAMRELFNESVFSDDWKGRRDRSMLALLYETGIRLSELINLKVTDVDEGRKNLKVFGKGSKERLIPIMPQTITSIISHINDRPVKSDSLFLTDSCKSLYPSFVYRRVNYYLSIVSSLQKCSPHVLRHTFATHLLNSGAELAAVKELLGHASLSSTQVYTHHTMAKLKEFHRASPLDRRSGQGK
jgi:integrase/recombinase XerC